MNILEYDVEYASECMKTIPVGYINKTVCGCGLTTVALENNENTIIAVPNRELIRNKTAQYPNNRTNNIILPVIGNTLPNDIEKYLMKIKKNDIPIKIMVTYDSIHKIEHLIDDCKLIIDESNKLLGYTPIKSKNKKSAYGKDAINKLLSIAEKHKNKTSFISATPTPIEYLPKWIAEIPQIEIRWKNVIKTIPHLFKRTYPYKSIISEVLIPLRNNSSFCIGEISAKKVIVFMNSVSNIIKSIKSANLNKEDVAIIAADSVENDVKISGYNRLKDPTKLPKYTFVTSVGFEGIDLNDNDAVSVIVSCTSKSFHMIDLLTDFKQAISRQRNKNNPNYNKFAFIYNQTFFDSPKEELLHLIDRTRNDINEAILIYENAQNNGLSGGARLITEHEQFIKYTQFNEQTNTFNVNDMLFNSDKYFILKIREQYTNGFDIMSLFDAETKINNIDKKNSLIIPQDINYVDMVEYFRRNHNNGNIDWGLYKTRTDWINIIDSCYKLYGKTWINQTFAEKMIKNYNNNYGQIEINVKSMFKIGCRYSRKDIKSQLQKLYNKNKISRTATHSDLFEFFNIKEVTINGNRCVDILSDIQ